MRTWIRARAGMLVAGAGFVLAGTLTGCWNPPTRPNTNIPKTNVNPGYPGGAAGTGYMGAAPSGQPVGTPSGVSNNGTPITRTTGAPATDGYGRSTMTSGATSSTPGAEGSPNYLNQTSAGAGASGKPIATSNNPTIKAIQPIANFGPASNAGSPPLDPPPPPESLPLRPIKRDLTPPVEPISTQNMDPKRNWQKTSPPVIPADSLPPPPPSKFRAGDLPPLDPPPN